MAGFIIDEIWVSSASSGLFRGLEDMDYVQSWTQMFRKRLSKEVADHDNTMIDGLVELKGEYESQEAELEANKTELEITKLHRLEVH